MNAFDHVANSIQVAIGKLDSDIVIKTEAVSDAIQVLKEAKDLALASGAAYTNELNKLKKQISDMEAHSAAAPPKPEPKAEPKHEPFKSDAKHPSPTHASHSSHSQPDKKK